MKDPAAAISVAMCTFNGGRFLDDQLRSIAWQSRLPDEVVVCDDGSVDDTKGVLRSFTRSAPFEVRLVVNRHRLGATRNFEKAISLCRGSLIALADQDDLWHPEKLALQERVLRSEGLDAVFTDAEVVGPDLHPLGYRMWEAVGFSRRERELMRNSEAVRVLLRRDVVTGATLLFSSRYREAVLPMPVGWVHDAWIAFVVAAFGLIGFVDQPLVKYRQHGGNQIGAAAPGRGWGRFLRTWSTTREESDAKPFLRQLERYRAGGDRLRELRALGIKSSVLAELEEKIAHARERVDLPPAGPRRLGVVARELASGRYHRYSGGWRSAGKDLLLRR